MSEKNSFSNSESGASNSVPIHVELCVNHVEMVTIYFEAKT